MKPLLHEELRRQAKNNYTVNIYCDGHFQFSKEVAEFIADRIEREYIPRPRYEDGEPVQFGGNVEGCDGAIDCYVIYDDGSGNVSGENDLSDEGASFGKEGERDRYKFIRHKQPKVLDADGVEINCGDEVWRTYAPESDSLVVESICDAGVICDLRVNGEPIVFDPKLLTHTEPDSWEKIEADATDKLTEYLISKERHVKVVKNIIRRAKALAERDA